MEEILSMTLTFIYFFFVKYYFLVSFYIYCEIVWCDTIIILWEKLYDIISQKLSKIDKNRAFLRNISNTSIPTAQILLHLKSRSQELFIELLLNYF